MMIYKIRLKKAYPPASAGNGWRHIRAFVDQKRYSAGKSVVPSTIVISIPPDIDTIPLAGDTVYVKPTSYNNASYILTERGVDIEGYLVEPEEMYTYELNGVEYEFLRPPSVNEADYYIVKPVLRFLSPNGEVTRQVVNDDSINLGEYPDGLEWGLFERGASWIHATRLIGAWSSASLAMTLRKEIQDVVNTVKALNEG